MDGTTYNCNKLKMNIFRGLTYIHPDDADSVDANSQNFTIVCGGLRGRLQHLTPQGKRGR